MKLTFLGASGAVTGSKFLLERENKKILVDCGLFQGLKALRLLNWETPSFDPSSINCILLTHGHLDHIGYIPRLVKLGFKGKIYATPLTLKIAEITLKDSAKIQEEEAYRANQENYSKHRPALPLYTAVDVDKSLKLFQPIEEGQKNLIEGFQVTFQYNGHILGSTFIEIEAEGKNLVFSGDIGREDDLLLYPPKRPKKADLILMETTYGGKNHPSEEALLPNLEKIVKETIQVGGSLFIPSFAVERTQLLMFMLWQLLKENKIPHVPIIMDSPMGANILHLFKESKGWDKLKPEEYQAICHSFKIVNHFTETLQLAHNKQPKIVIAGSGMVTEGRILNYLEAESSNPKNTLLFVGYQAEGTRGRRLLDGEKEIKIYGKILPFRMRVRTLEGLSAHADQQDLLNWLSDLEQKPEKIFLVHGEEPQAQAFKNKLKEVKGWEAQIPHLNETITI